MMNMIESIEKNPFRILGVYADASASEMKRNETKIRRFLEVGKSISFPTDELGGIGEVERTVESVDFAVACLNMPQEKLKHALFWYVKEDSLDHNTSISSLLSNNVEQAILRTLEMLHGYSSRTKFEEAIVGNDVLDESALVNLYLEELSHVVDASKILSIMNNSIYMDDCAYLKSKIIGKPIDIITAEISASKIVDRNDPQLCLRVGKKLITSTKKALTELKAILGKEDMQFQMTADALAKQILQLGINYYNGTKDDDSIEQALKIQQYALSLACGKVVKDRCQQNVDILLKHQKEVAPAEVRTEDKAIEALLADFCKKPDKISFSIELLNECKPCLQRIKEKIGVSNVYYLRISTKVVGNALHNLIEEVNEVQKTNEFKLPSGETVDMDLLLGEDARRAKLNRIKDALRSAWKAMEIMDTFDMESDFRSNRYNPNQSTLKGLCNQVGISTYSSVSSRTSSSSSVSSNSSQKSTSHKDEDLTLGESIAIIVIIHVVWGIIAVCTKGRYDTGIEAFFMGMFAGIAGWILPINFLGYYLLNWIWKGIKNS